MASASTSTRRGHGHGGHGHGHHGSATSSSPFDLKNWLENVLKNYCSQLISRKTPLPKSAPFPFDRAVIIEPIEEIDLELKVLDVQLIALTAKSEVDEIPVEFSEPGEEPTDDQKKVLKQTKRVAESLQAVIKYMLGNDRTVRKEVFLIELANVKVDKLDHGLLQKFVETETREIDFYTKIVTKLEDWSFFHGVNFESAVPICFYGQYQFDPPTEKEEQQQQHGGKKVEHGTGIKSVVKSGENNNVSSSRNPMLTNMSALVKKISQHSVWKVPDSRLDTVPISEAMTMLLTNDLDNMRFQVNQGKLSIGEVKAVLRELARIHALSWAFEADLNQVKRDGEGLLHLWPFLLQPSAAIELATNLVDSGIDPVLALIKLKMTVTEYGKYEKWLTQIRKRLHSIFEDLLKPPHAPLPATIIHMDLQSQNIAFRSKAKTGGATSKSTTHSSKSSTTKSTTDGNANANNIDCRIFNWKLVSYGSPMHDVAFLFLTSLPPSVREAATSKLLEHYYQMFEETATKYELELPFTFEMLESEYKKCFFCAFLFVLGNFEEPNNMEHANEEDNQKNPPLTFETMYPYFDNFMYALQEVIDSGF